MSRRVFSFYYALRRPEREFGFAKGTVIRRVVLQFAVQLFGPPGCEQSAHQFLVTAREDAAVGVGGRGPRHLSRAVVIGGIEQVSAADFLITRRGHSREKQISAVSEEEDAMDIGRGGEVNARAAR